MHRVWLKQIYGSCLEVLGMMGMEPARRLTGGIQGLAIIGWAGGCTLQGMLPLLVQINVWNYHLSGSFPKNLSKPGSMTPSIVSQCCTAHQDQSQTNGFQNKMEILICFTNLLLHPIWQQFCWYLDYYLTHAVFAMLNFHFLGFPFLLSPPTPLIIPN